MARALLPGDLIAHGSTYDGQTVSVVGTVSDLRAHVSRKGNAYATFELCASSACVRVFEWGTPALSDSQRLTVHGKFSVEKRVGPYTFHDEIESDAQP